MKPAWTNVNELVATLRKRWDSGRYARDYAAGLPWIPLELPVRAPTAAELLDRFDEALRWAEQFRRQSSTAGGRERFSVGYRTVKGRNLGANSVPARIRIDTFEQLCSLLNTTGDVNALDAVMKQTSAALPALIPWVTAHPLRALQHAERWSDVLATVAWIAENDTTQLYLRQIDVEGVDTKFVERHQKLLDDLLTELLPPERIDSRFATAEFTRRFGFRPKPGYTRFRLLSPQPAFPAPLSELRLRTDELADVELVIETVFVVENEVTYLAFPAVPCSIVVFGSGFGLTALEDLPWMQRKTIVYWGDIDTHGFDILNRLRSRFDSVQSMLMDEETLLAHAGQWVWEAKPTNRPLPHLSGPEGALYRDLIEDRYGRGVRLEQERVRFSLLRRAIGPWTA